MSHPADPSPVPESTAPGPTRRAPGTPPGPLPAPSAEQLAAVVAEVVGTPVASTLWVIDQLSRVAALRLADGREVVVKARPAEPRLAACTALQAVAAAAGLPCPTPLGTAVTGGWAVTVEEHRPGGRARRVEELGVQAFVDLALALDDAIGGRAGDPALGVGIGLDAGRPLPTPPPWADPQHPGAGTWPDRDVRLPPMTADEPVPWLEDAAARVRVRVAGCDGPLRIGHLDFETHNMRWHDPADARGTASAGGPGPTLAALRSLDDWDSLGVAPEPLIVGQAAGTFTATRDRFTDPTVAQSAEYVARWLATSGRTWSRDEHELAWAAGLWTKLFNAQDRVVHHDVAGVMAHARPDAAERLRLAGA